MKAIIYGAVAKQPTPKKNTLSRKLKRLIYETRERLFFRLGKATYLDYRNYDKPFSTNVGDIAICESISDLITERLPSIELEYRNWGELRFDRTSPQEKTPLIVAGGGYFFINSDGNLPNRLAHDLEYVEKNGCPFILFGVGLNHPGTTTHKANYLKSSSDRKLVERLLGASKLISVRDERTREFLSEFSNKKIRVIGDPALVLGNNQNTPISNAQTTNKKVIIGLNLPFHGPTATRLLKNNINEYILFLKELQSKTQCEFRYFIHYDTEHIIPHLLSDRGIRTEAIHAQPKEIQKEYKKLSIHIGGMLHSCILASSVGTPCISLAYDIKHHGFMETIGMTKNSFSYIDFDRNRILIRALELINESKSSKIISKQVNSVAKLIYGFADECIRDISR